MQRRALVRRPGPRLNEQARRQWRGYAAALQAEGWELYEVEPATEAPDGVFVEDTAIVYGDSALITRPGAEQRRPETAGTDRALRGLGYRTTFVQAPGTLEGGDVLKHGGTVWVGVGGRTNQAGADQLAAHLEPLGATVVAVPLTQAPRPFPDASPHLKSAVTALPDGTLVGYAPLPDLLPVPEAAGASVVLLDEGTVLMSTSAPRTRELFEQRGLRVVAVDLSELERLGGCVTSLSIRLR